MNVKLVENWNNVVKNDDDVIIAGDFIHSGNIGNVTHIINSLNGNKWLVYGNHCYQNKFERPIIRELFNDRCFDAIDFKVEDKEMENGYTMFHITHYPCEAWTRGAIHLHGHVHSRPQNNGDEVLLFKPMRYDIGVDNNNYFPVSYEQIVVIITKQYLNYK
jgi:calcineurin-like phosphoesterase family protein